MNTEHVSGTQSLQNKVVIIDETNYIKDALRILEVERASSPKGSGIEFFEAPGESMGHSCTSAFSGIEKLFPAIDAIWFSL